MIRLFREAHTASAVLANGFFPTTVRKMAQIEAIQFEIQYDAYGPKRVCVLQRGVR